MIGLVFASEGIQKFLFASELGAGRFGRIGIPAPGVMGPLVGVVEIVAGTLVVIGLLARPAAMALWVNISVAVAAGAREVGGAEVAMYQVPELAPPRGGDHREAGAEVAPGGAFSGPPSSAASR